MHCDALNTPDHLVYWGNKWEGFKSPWTEGHYSKAKFQEFVKSEGTLEVKVVKPLV